MKKKSTLQVWWKQHGQTILMIAIVCLASMISYKFGQINTYNATQVDVVVRDIKNVNPAQERASIAIEALEKQGINIHQETEKKKEEKKNCMFVASRNSKKYHTKDCKYGKKIKAANLVCFKNIEEAKNKGYQPAGGCFKNN